MMSNELPQPPPDPEVLLINHYNIRAIFCVFHKFVQLILQQHRVKLQSVNAIDFSVFTQS